MRTMIRSLIVASVLAWPAVADAGPVEDFAAAFGICGNGDDTACGEAVWTFVDVTGDDHLTTAELSRLLRVASEWTVAEQGGVDGLGLGGAGVNEEMGRTGAVVMGFLGGPLTAKLVLENFDYDGDGRLARAEVFADAGQGAFVTTIKAQMEQLPQYASLIMMAVMAAQEQGMMGGGDAMQSGDGATMISPEPEPEPTSEAAMVEPAATGPSFALRNVDNMVLTDGGIDIFVISGEIVNLTGQTLAVPDAVARVFDGNRQVLKTWRFAPSPSRLGPNESAAFIGRLDNAPQDVADWSVVLADGG